MAPPGRGGHGTEGRTHGDPPQGSSRSHRSSQESVPSLLGGMAGGLCVPPPPAWGGHRGPASPPPRGLLYRAGVLGAHQYRDFLQRRVAVTGGGGGTTTDPVGMATGWLGGGVHVTWGSPPAPVAPVLPPLPSHLPAGLQAGRPWGDRRHFGPRVGSWGHPCPPTHQSPRCRGPCPGAVGPQPGFSCPASSSSRREAGPTRDLPAAGGAHGEEDGHRCVPPTPLPTPLTLSPTEAASKGLGGGDTQRSPPPAAAASTHGCTGVALHGDSLAWGWPCTNGLCEHREPPALYCGLRASVSPLACDCPWPGHCAFGELWGPPPLSSCTPQPGPRVSGHGSAPPAADPRGVCQRFWG